MSAFCETIYGSAQKTYATKRAKSFMQGKREVSYCKLLFDQFVVSQTALKIENTLVKKAVCH